MLPTASNRSSTSLESRHSNEDKGLLCEEGAYPTVNHSPIRRWYHHVWIVLTGVNLVLACITTYGIVASANCIAQPQGWNTELLDARGAVQYEERAYTGALTFDRNKGEAVRLDDSEMEFFGRPSPEIDASWQHLLHGVLS